jgi:hypothetical protein
MVLPNPEGIGALVYSRQRAASVRIDVVKNGSMRETIQLDREFTL